MSTAPVLHNRPYYNTVFLSWMTKKKASVRYLRGCCRNKDTRWLLRENGFDALLKLKEFLPEVIISDLNMPKMSDLNFSRSSAVASRRFQ